MNTLGLGGMSDSPVDQPGGSGPSATPLPQPLPRGEGEWSLALAELEASSRLGLAVLLALDHARVAGQEAGDLQNAAQIRLVVGERARDAVTHSAGLAGQSAAGDSAVDIELIVAIRHQERLGQQHAKHRAGEVLDDFPVVDGDLALAGPDPDAGDRVLAPAG